ncbi:Filament-like plant protein 3 [Abeliophyllum distichum]|uniref:Filament-like plant protein 3 n=1 Tax=Abeliophyllum distichum TaxID=126358 RepID=A0ABD1SDK0_9LAMI
MDRRSWLWRRKSSEKSPGGETESSGSISSHSERLSDDQTPSNHITLSTEITSKAAPSDEELNDTVKILSEKLSEALLDIHAKEDLVKQHAKVAEEAVSGWERAENEALFLKKQTEALTQKNLVLEERVGHLDRALKECLRQLRREREEQEGKIYDAVAKKTREWESTKSDLENELARLHSQLQHANTDTITSMFADVRSKLEVAEKLNSVLKLELLSKAKELKLSTRERDLNTHAAETASKQHLESIKKVTKLEAECRRLKVVARKAAPPSDRLSVTASSVYVESFTDSQSDNGERLLATENDSCKLSGMESTECEACHPIGRSLAVPSVDIDLMDDFLEMEKLAALPVTESRSRLDTGAKSGKNPLNADLVAMISRTAELEEQLEKVKAEKINIEFALSKCQYQLKISQDQLKETEAKLADLRTQLATANEAKSAAQIEVEDTNIKLKKLEKFLEEAEANLVEIQNQSIITNEATCTVKMELEAAKLKKAEAESQIRVLEIELKTLHSIIGTLEEEVEKERNFSGKIVVKYQLLENEISRMKLDSQIERSAIINEFRMNQDKELTEAATKFSECQKTIASLGRQLKSLATLEDFLIVSDSERQVEIL